MALILDEFGRPLSAAKKATRPPRTLRAKYDAAQTTTENANHWTHADSLSADAGLLPLVRQRLRDRARYEAANNSYCNGMLRTLANDCIGTGPKLGIQTGDAETDSAIEWAFYLWTVAVDWPAKLRLLRMAKARDGEGFARFTSNRALRHPIKLDLLTYEAEQIANPYGYGLGSLTDGVILDDYGNVIGYTVLREHPGQSIGWSAEDTETVRAADMIHVAHIERAGQHRGVPEIAPALPLYAILRRYTLSVLGAAETAADLAGVIKTQQLPPGSDPDEMEPMDEIEIVRRTLLTLPKGHDISQFKAEQPTTTYGEFKNQIIAEIARCLNMPRNVASGDSSQFNYSSARLDWRTYEGAIRIERSQWEWTACTPTLQRWWEEARLTPEIQSLGFDRASPLPRHSWAWDASIEIDPAKAATAQATRLESLTTTLQREFAKEGLDWEQELQQLAREAALKKQLKLTAEPPKPGKPAEPAADETDEDAEDADEE